MDMEFRSLLKKDLAAVIQLFNKLAEEHAEVSFSEVISEEEILNWMEDPDIFTYVALEDERLLGVLRAKRGEGSRNHSVFLTAAIDQNYRGNKIAKQLTLYALEQLKTEGIKIARAYIYSNNRSSINTILSCGFTFAGNVYQHHYDEKTQAFVDDLIFHKIL